jgi:hypothetical protein
MVCGATADAAENLSVEPAVVSVSVAHCSLSANVTPLAFELVTVTALNAAPPEVTLWPLVPLNVTVPEECVKLPLLDQLPVTFRFPAGAVKVPLAPIVSPASVVPTPVVSVPALTVVLLTV